MKKAFRIRKNEEFSAIIADRHSVSDHRYVVYFARRKEEKARVGISVSKKMGNAVKRNLIKRQLREMVRAIVDFENCPVDLIVIARKPYLDHGFMSNKNDLEILIKKAII